MLSDRIPAFTIVSWIWVSVWAYFAWANYVEGNWYWPLLALASGVYLLAGIWVYICHQRRILNEAVRLITHSDSRRPTIKP
jgi:hypothetical protein